MIRVSGIIAHTGNSHNPGVVTIKLVCDGLGISLYDFFDTEGFKSTELEDMD